MEYTLKKGAVYKNVSGRYPFDCPFGIFVEKVPSGFLRFVWNGKDMLINGGMYEMVNTGIEHEEYENTNLLMNVMSPDGNPMSTKRAESIVRTILANFILYRRNK